jgi:hypothetical protein
MTSISAVKVFTATRAADRDALGNKLSAWLQAHPEFEVLRTFVAQSSDASFHCLSIVLFLSDRRKPQP